MSKSVWSDPYTAMNHLMSIHRKYWISATYEEYRRANPGYTGGMPLTVRDFIGHARWALSTLGKQQFQKDFNLPQDYFEALCEYVRLFPMDSPEPGELPSRAK